MRIVVASDGDAAGEAAALRVLEHLTASSGRVLGVATGSSPQPLYRALAGLAPSLHDVRALHDVRVFALDEYVGLPSAHPESYHSIVHRDVVVPLHLDPLLVHVPDGQAADPTAAADAYEAAIAQAGGVDVQILGIGTNGHIGFNEPGSPRDSRTRVVDLAESTRIANSRFFGDGEDVPRRAITQGVATILSADHIVLVASGERKARAVRDMVTGPVTEEHPASLLREHPSVEIFLDRAAAGELGELRDIGELAFAGVSEATNAGGASAV